MNMLHTQAISRLASKRALGRFIPEPKGSGSAFRDVVDVVAGVGKGAAAAAGLDTSLQGLLTQQMELQQQMMTVSMHSNVEKTRHDTRMAPVRNLRVN